MKDIEVKFEVVTELPKRHFTKESKYDKILNDFLSQKAKIVKLRIPDNISATYLTTQLKKRKAVGLIASMVNGEVYLQKV